MLQNKYAGECQSCHTPVAATAGFVYRHPDTGAWTTVCNGRACHTHLGLLGEGSATLSFDGAPAMPDDEAIAVARFPYDRDRVSLVRSMPGARWNGQRKWWTVSVSPADLPVTLDLARRAKLDIDESILRLEGVAPAAAVEACERAERDGLYDFQRDGVRFLAAHPKALLADSMGTGKTVQTLVALPEGAAVLVVCPSVVKRNWEAEAAKWRPDYTVAVLSGRKSFRMPEAGEIVVVNFDILPSDLAHRLPGRPTSAFSLIVDEAHYCKNKKTKRHNACHLLSQHAERTWLLSGTPMTNQPFDLLSVLRVAGLDRTVFGGFNRFLQLFHGRKGRWGGYEFGTPEPEVAERLRRVSLRRTLDEVMPDLPRHRYQSIVVNGIPKALAKELDEVGEDYGALFDMGELPPFEELSAVRKKLAKCRTDMMLKLVEEYEETETPVLVFSAHRYPIDSLSEREGWAVITGDTSAEERQRIVGAFQAGQLKGVGLTIAAGGVGITLTHASTSIFVDLDWTPANNAQAEDRIRRIGQKAASLLCIRMSSSHPVDIRVQELLEEKTERFRIAIESKLEAGEVERIELDDETEEDRLARIEAWLRAAREVVEREYTDKIENVLEREERRSFNGETGVVYATSAKSKARVRKAFNYMLSVCDGAIDDDGMGFNKIDAALAHWLPMSGLDLDTDERAQRLMQALVVRYPAQVGDILKGS